MQFYTLYYKKKALLFASLLLALSSNVSAQQVDAVLYEVTYQFAHVRDTNNRQKLYREAFMLRIGRNASEFASLTNQQNAKNIKEQVEHATATGQSEINLGAWKPATPEKIFIWQTKHKLYKTTVFRSTTYKIEYPLETMQWKISRATKTVAGYKCQLATGSWKGRTYNAWFSTDLPFPTGPWKLQGLPGVIMEATDLKNEVSFVATAVNRKDLSTAPVMLPSKAVAVSEAQLKRLMETPAAATATNDIVVQASISGQRTTAAKPKGINNPLEKE